MKNVMRRRSAAASDRPARIAENLRRAMPEARVELNHRSPWELLVATILSAQCTDQRVNQVTPALFTRYPGPHEMAKAKPAELETLIKSTGFYKSKAKNLVGCAQAVVERFQGEVPRTMDELTTIPGVGRKTANVILGGAYGQPAVVVDTHVIRVANRLALTGSGDPVEIERDLQRIYPREEWTGVSQRLLLHGRYTCVARTPRCGVCPIYDECTWKGKLPR
ncbi:Endonuclease III [Nitrospira moscoviensis]|uniref:Endonuclease III n=2 Tax=Nitrospira moscoviensis TaxID=42253 RepID=A0A0K2GC23_NITMO|nr:Endonuclease III [Nitrospira moscoviensis]